MERRALQIVIFLAGLVPVLAGGVGAVMGDAAFGSWADALWAQLTG